MIEFGNEEETMEPVESVDEQKMTEETMEIEIDDGTDC